MQRKIKAYQKTEPEKYEYLKKNIYPTPFCEIETTPKMVEDANHIVMQCKGNESLREQMFQELELTLQQLKLDKTVNIREHMIIDTNKDSPLTIQQKIAQQKIALSKGLITKSLIKNINNKTNNKTKARYAAIALQEVTLRFHKLMSSHRNKWFFDLKKSKGLYKWKFHTHKHAHLQLRDHANIIGLRNLTTKLARIAADKIATRSRNDAVT